MNPTIQTAKTRQENPKFHNYLLITRAKPKTLLSQSGGNISLTSMRELFADEMEIRGRRAVEDPDNSEDLPVGLEILPWRRRGPTKDELEAERARIPRLMSEW